MQISEVLQSSRYQSLKQRRASSSIELMAETKVSTNSSSIELPPEIDALIDNKMYRRKFAKLIRDGYSNELMQLVSMAKDKEHPSRWFAKATKTKPAPGCEDQPTYWQRSLTYLAKLKEVAKKAAYVAHKLNTDVTKFIYKQIWNKVNVTHWADLAADTPHTKPGQSVIKYFAYLCKHGEELYGSV